MKLTKIVPARRKTVQFEWCRKKWMVMSEKYREARLKLDKPKDDACYWCSYKFKDGDPIALAGAWKKENKILCEKCVDDLAD